MRKNSRIHKRIYRILTAVMVCAVLTLMSGCDLPDWLYDAGYWFEDVAEAFRWWFDDTATAIADKIGSEEDEPVEEDEPAEEVETAADAEDAEPFLVTPLPEIRLDTEVNEEVVVLEEGEITADEGVVDAALAEISLDETLKAERYFAYHTLNDEQRKIYKLIYNSLFSFGGKTPMPTTDADLIDRVFACVLADNPELFYIRGYNLIRYERGGVVESISISGLYTMDSSEAKAHWEKVDDYVRKCLQGAPTGTDDYVKIKYLYEYIIRNTEYDLNAENSQNFLSVFENGRSVCQGYSTAMQYLMNELGMFCTVVRGVTNTNENHAWNLVRSNGEYYYVDVTWGDISYNIKVDASISALPELPDVSYEYLCVTTEDIEPTHRLKNYFDVPECTSRRDYYFVREGNYFEAVDDEKLEEVFVKAYDRGDSYVMIKCSNQYVFDLMSEYMTGQGRVFDYTRGLKKISYVPLKSLNEFIFYL